MNERSSKTFSNEVHVSLLYKISCTKLDFSPVPWAWGITFSNLKFNFFIWCSNVKFKPTTITCGSHKKCSETIPNPCRDALFSYCTVQLNDHRLHWPCIADFVFKVTAVLCDSYIYIFFIYICEFLLDSLAKVRERPYGFLSWIIYYGESPG